MGHGYPGPEADRSGRGTLVMQVHGGFKGANASQDTTGMRENRVAQGRWCDRRSALHQGCTRELFQRGESMRNSGLAHPQVVRGGTKAALLYHRNEDIKLPNRYRHESISCMRRCADFV